MKNNKTALLVELKEKTNLTENEGIIFNSILEDTFIFGKKNKKKIISETMDKLNKTEEEADTIYNTFMEIFKRRIKYKLRHPFKSID